MARKDREQEETPVVSKKTTREDLAAVAAQAVEAAKEAAHGAEVAAEAAGAALTALSENGEGEPAMEVSRQDVEQAPLAFEAFMARLAPVLKRFGDRVQVSELAGWVKIEGRQGHKVYIPKSKTAVSRVESTLDPDLIRGAKRRDDNGRIASEIPADPRSVGEAIRLLATLEEPVRPRAAPQRRGR